jgi:hypothetical protein
MSHPVKITVYGTASDEWSDDQLAVRLAGLVFRGCVTFDAANVETVTQEQYEELGA